jgi:hypothetical protein
VRTEDLAYRAVVHLYMNYYFAWITMGKTSLVNLVRSKLSYHFGRETRPPNNDETAERLSRFCIKAATKLLRLFDDMTRSGKLARFSFTDFQACSIATIVILLARVLEPDLAYECKIAFGMDCLRKMAVGNTAAMSGVKFVEALKSIANQAIMKLSQSSSITETSDCFTASAMGPNYQEWIDWYSSGDQVQQDFEDNARLNLEETIADAQRDPIPVLQPEPSIPQEDAWSSQQPCGAESSNWEFHEQETLAAQVYPVEASHLFQALSMDHSFNTTPFHNGETFLLGLTGLDVLDLHDFTSSLA